MKPIIRQYFDMIEAGKKFQSLQDDVLYAARVIDPSINNITEAIELVKKLRYEDSTRAQR